MIQLVTFDFHNTIAHCDAWFKLEIRRLPAAALALIDADALARIGDDALTEAYRTLRMNVIESGIEIEAIDGLEQVYAHFELSYPREEIEAAVEKFMREALLEAEAVPTAIEGIRLLHDRGIRIGVISSAIYHPFLEWTLEKFGLADAVEFVVTSASAGIYKSNPALYAQVLESLGVPPTAAIHVGDSARWDVWSPQQAGMRAVLVPNGEPLSDLQHATEAEPDHIAATLFDAAEWILQQQNPALIIDILTLFPGMFEGVLGESILKRAHAKGLIDIRVHNIRDWTHDKHRTADDTPYGGGAGMVMKAPPIVEAVEDVLGDELPSAHVAIMSAGGRRFSQEIAQDLSEHGRVVLICGHYEGIDERVSEILGADELSIGDYVLTGGELPAMVIADTISRLVPGVITEESILDESHLGEYVEYPHYTRPQEYRGLEVPEVLLSGHHARIAEWRTEQAKLRTARWRPDLLTNSDPDS
ncbi:MAG: tRNA (guanosine(37)-N1)-methyltransferase TrmD [Thermomicrobiales bacterium]|nr:tRNA (guanosine(37)-N1)-methyltransferase TrmD [Thermomicrobiales bacterium]